MNKSIFSCSRRLEDLKLIFYLGALILTTGRVYKFEAAVLFPSKRQTVLKPLILRGERVDMKEVKPMLLCTKSTKMTNS